MVAVEALRSPYTITADARVKTARVGGRGSAPFSRAAMALVVAASVLTLGALVFPLWSVTLTAPQYPEGLGMKILVHTVRGATSTDLGNINHLNRYIGMKSIEADTIPELGFMPWIVVALSVTGFAVAAFRRRAALYTWIGVFAAVCAAGLLDFGRWEYDYGHNLDPRAVLKIPGMSYQPPIIGARQLLNFRALSVPDGGGVMLMLALLLAVIAGAFAWRDARRFPRSG